MMMIISIFFFLRLGGEAIISNYGNNFFHICILSSIIYTQDRKKILKISGAICRCNKVLTTDSEGKYSFL